MKRWKALLIPLKHEISDQDVFSSLIIGVMGNHILPAKAGEVISAYLLGRKKAISKAAVFGTVVMERLLDIAIILLLSGIALYFIGLKNELVQRVELIGVAIIAIIGAGVVLFLKYKTIFQKIILILTPPALKGKISKLLESLSSGLVTIKNIKHFLTVFFWSLLFWIAVIFSLVPVLYAFDYGTPVPVYTIFVVLLFITFGMAIPAAPAGLGIYQYAASLAVMTCLPKEIASLPYNLAQIGAFSIVSHFTMVFPEIILGFIYFFRENLTWDNFCKIDGILAKDPNIISR